MACNVASSQQYFSSPSSQPLRNYKKKKKKELVRWIKLFSDHPIQGIAISFGERSLSFCYYFLPISLFSQRPKPSSERERSSSEMVQRLTYRKRHSYATKSNQTRVVKTPGFFFPTPQRPKPYFSFFYLMICSCLCLFYVHSHQIQLQIVLCIICFFFFPLYYIH